MGGESCTVLRLRLMRNLAISHTSIWSFGAGDPKKSVLSYCSVWAGWSHFLVPFQVLNFIPSMPSTRTCLTQEWLWRTLMSPPSAHQVGLLFSLADIPGGGRLFGTTNTQHNCFKLVPLFATV